MKIRRKVFDCLVIIAVFFAVYFILSFGIPAFKIKLDAEPLQYFLTSISHMVFVKLSVSFLSAFLLPTAFKLIAILASSRSSEQKMTLRNVRIALKYQLPPHRSFIRFFINFFVTHNGLGMFSRNSHVNQRNGKEKIAYSSFESAKKAACKMEQKHGTHFSVYKCTYCDGFHIGRNRDNK